MSKITDSDLITEDKVDFLLAEAKEQLTATVADAEALTKSGVYLLGGLLTVITALVGVAGAQFNGAKSDFDPTWTLTGCGFERRGRRNAALKRPCPARLRQRRSQARQVFVCCLCPICTRIRRIMHWTSGRPGHILRIMVGPAFGDCHELLR